MMNEIKQKVSDAGETVVDKTKNVKNKIVDGVERAADWAKDQIGAKDGAGTKGVRERMDVVASCGKKVGVVDHVDGKAIKLTRNDSPDDMHHFIPLDWVASVDNQVHLNKNATETMQGWKIDAAACGCGG